MLNQNIGGILPPKMDDENNETPHETWDDSGGVQFPYFWKYPHEYIIPGDGLIAKAPLWLLYNGSHYLPNGFFC